MKILISYALEEAELWKNVKDKESTISTYQKQMHLECQKQSPAESLLIFAPKISEQRLIGRRSLILEGLGFFGKRLIYVKFNSCGKEPDSKISWNLGRHFIANNLPIRLKIMCCHPIRTWSTATFNTKNCPFNFLFINRFNQFPINNI